MIWRSRLLTIITATLAASPVLAQDRSTCTFHGEERLVEVRYLQETGQAPCEVAYTKDGEERVLWTARSDAGFCRDKAGGLVQTLEGSGWACSTQAGTTAAPAPAATPAREQADAENGSPDPQDRMAAAEPEAAQELEAPDGDTEQAIEELEEAAPRGSDGEEVAAYGEAARDTDVLNAAVERDLSRLKKTAEDNVEASIGSFGDLNGDAVPDAAVLITFDADGNDHAQYLVAYVAQDGTYHPAASRFIGGRYRKVFGADVRGIQDGRIELDLQVMAPDDPFCCPSGSERTAFRLENGELVDVR